MLGFPFRGEVFASVVTLFKFVLSIIDWDPIIGFHQWLLVMNVSLIGLSIIVIF